MDDYWNDYSTDYGDGMQYEYQQTPANSGPQYQTQAQNYSPVSSTYDDYGNLVFTGSGSGSQPTAYRPQYTQTSAQPSANVADKYLAQYASESKANEPWFAQQRATAFAPSYAPRPTGNAVSNTSTRVIPGTPQQQLAGTANSAGGLTNNAAAPTYFLNRLKTLLENPTSADDPTLKWLQEQGENQRTRTAGAKRMRFSGKTQLDAINQGQGIASGYRTQLINQALQQAQQEASRWGDESRVGLANMNFNAGRSDNAGAELGSSQAVQQLQRLLQNYL